MTAVYWLAVAVVLLYFVTVTGFILVMHCKAVLDRGDDLAIFFKVPAFIWGVLAVPGDMLFNVFIGSVIFRERPRELMFTERCKRHAIKDDWRGDRARWWCDEMQKLDPGHCYLTSRPELYPKGQQ